MAYTHRLVASISAENARMSASCIYRTKPTDRHKEAKKQNLVGFGSIGFRTRLLVSYHAGIESAAKHTPIDDDQHTSVLERQPCSIRTQREESTPEKNSWYRLPGQLPSTCYLPHLPQAHTPKPFLLGTNKVSPGQHV